jgi:hypothetical protein
MVDVGPAEPAGPPHKPAPTETKLSEPLPRKTARGQRERRKSLRPHPTRDAIVDAMRSYGRPISPAMLARTTGNTIGATAYHVRVLWSAGVLELADEGRVRGAVEHFYVVREDHAEDWQDPLVAFQHVCAAITLPDPEGGVPEPVELDDQARVEMKALLDEVRPKVLSVVEAAARRRPGARPSAAP